MNHTYHRRRSAFTCIELLVIAAIIGILAALLIPTIARHRLRTEDLKAKAAQVSPPQLEDASTNTPPRREPIPSMVLIEDRAMRAYTANGAGFGYFIIKDTSIDRYYMVTVFWIGASPSISTIELKGHVSKPENEL